MRTSMSKKLIAIVGSAALLAVLPGCGGEAETSASSPSPEATDASEPAPPPTTNAKPTEASARAMLDENFRSFAAKKFEQACASQTPEYSATDEPSCEAEAKDAYEEFDEFGVSKIPSTVEVSIKGASATAVFAFTYDNDGDSGSLRGLYYLAFVDGEWRISGDARTGDLSKPPSTLTPEQVVRGYFEATNCAETFLYTDPEFLEFAVCEDDDSPSATDVRVETIAESATEAKIRARTTLFEGTVTVKKSERGWLVSATQ